MDKRGFTLFIIPERSGFPSLQVRVSLGIFYSVLILLLAFFTGFLFLVWDLLNSSQDRALMQENLQLRTQIEELRIDAHVLQRQLDLMEVYSLQIKTTKLGSDSSLPGKPIKSSGAKKKKQSKSLPSITNPSADNHHEHHQEENIPPTEEAQKDPQKGQDSDSKSLDEGTLHDAFDAFDPSAGRKKVSEPTAIDIFWSLILPSSLTSEPVSEANRYLELPEIEDVRQQFGALRQRAQLLFPQIWQQAYEAQAQTSQFAFVPRSWPVRGIFTSGFGYRRSPFTRKVSYHDGIDIAAPSGTKILAPADGKVVFSEMRGGYGRMIELDHGFGIRTRYAHNRRLLVKKGDQVKAGDTIATVGSTGRSTGPHLHYEIRIDGISVDPMIYLPPL